MTYGINIIERIVEGPVLDPHPAKILINADPNIPTMVIECVKCGEQWSAPTSQGDVKFPIPDNVRSCPGCGAYSVTELIP